MCILTFCRIFLCGHFEATFKIDEGTCNFAERRGLHCCSWLCNPPFLQEQLRQAIASNINAAAFETNAAVSQPNVTAPEPGIAADEPNITMPEPDPYPCPDLFAYTRDTVYGDITPESFTPSQLIVFDFFRLSLPVIESLENANIRAAIDPDWDLRITEANNRTMQKHQDMLEMLFPVTTGHSSEGMAWEGARDWFKEILRSFALDMEIAEVQPCGQPGHEDEEDGFDEQSSTGYGDSQTSRSDDSLTERGYDENLIEPEPEDREADGPNLFLYDMTEDDTEADDTEADGPHPWRYEVRDHHRWVDYPNLTPHNPFPRVDDVPTNPNAEAIDFEIFIDPANRTEEERRQYADVDANVLRHPLTHEFRINGQADRLLTVRGPSLYENADGELDVPPVEL